MFRHEFVPHAMPDPAGIPPHVREMVGPQYNTVGIIAKQPGSNWLHRKQLAEKRHNEAQRMKVLAATKGFIGAVRRAQFDQRTDKRNLVARLGKKVKDCLQAADEDLECRRNKLREFLLREESEYTEEYVMRAQKVKDEMIEIVKKRNLDIKLKREADERRVVEEKRLQQYRLRCEELRIKLSEFNRQELRDAHLKQMEDKLSKQEAERERDNLYNKLKQKDIETMKEYEDRLERERQKRVKDIAEVYKKQLEGKQLLLEEDKRLKEEEAKLIETLRQNIELERKQEKEEEKKKRLQLQAEMMEQLRQEKESLEQKKKEERELELAFCKLIQDELEREKAKQTDTRKQMRREQELYLAYLHEVEQQQKEEERKIDELRQNDMKEILRKKEEVEIQACKAKENLKNDVLKFRKIQIEERQRRAEAENEMKKLEEAEDLRIFERYKLEEEMLKKENEKKKKMYGEELKRQEELSRIKREKEIEDEEIILRNALMAEEQYLRKVDLSMDILCDKKHPFRKKLEGAAQ